MYYISRQIFAFHLTSLIRFVHFRSHGYVVQLWAKQIQSRFLLTNLFAKNLWCLSDFHHFSSEALWESLTHIVAVQPLLKCFFLLNRKHLFLLKRIRWLRLIVCECVEIFYFIKSLKCRPSYSEEASQIQFSQYLNSVGYRLHSARTLFSESVDLSNRKLFWADMSKLGYPCYCQKWRVFRHQSESLSAYILIPEVVSAWGGTVCGLQEMIWKPAEEQSLFEQYSKKDTV